MPSTMPMTPYKLPMTSASKTNDGVVSGMIWIAKPITEKSRPASMPPVILSAMVFRFRHHPTKAPARKAVSKCRKKTAGYSVTQVIPQRASQNTRNSAAANR